MKRIFSVLLLSLFVSTFAMGQMTQFKALFLFNFAKNVNWPSHTQGSDFVITVIGDQELAAKLKDLARVRKIGNSNMVIKECTGAEDIEESQIIFLSASRSSLMPIIASYQKDNPVLLVAGKQGLCEQGAGISFHTANGKLQFEVCTRNVESHGLKMSQKLIALGTVVN